MFFAVLLTAGLATAQTSTPAAKPAPPKPAATKAAPKAAAEPKPAPTPRPDGLYAYIQTSSGNITAQLFEKEAPVTVKNFIDLSLGRKSWTHPKTGARSSKPLYPGTIFHRVIPRFMIQGGDPLGTGMGGVDTIKDEFVPTLNFDKPGRLAMANIGEPNTGSCQFFITEAATEWLNQKHTIFGQVVENQELVTTIANAPRGGRDRPEKPVTIQKITFERWAAGKLAPLAPAARPAATKAPAKAAPKAAPKK
jgi:peptidyl-prolyl cis-trans isomerase A (cyclophilin A)